MYSTQQLCFGIYHTKWVIINTGVQFHDSGFAHYTEEVTKIGLSSTTLVGSHYRIYMFILNYTYYSFVKVGIESCIIYTACGQVTQSGILSTLYSGFALLYQRGDQTRTIVHCSQQAVARGFLSFKILLNYCVYRPIGLIFMMNASYSEQSHKWKLAYFSVVIGRIWLSEFGKKVERCVRWFEYSVSFSLSYCAIFSRIRLYCPLRIQDWRLNIDHVERYPFIYVYIYISNNYHQSSSVDDIMSVLMSGTKHAWINDNDRLKRCNMAWNDGNIAAMG